ncbi:MAG: PAS domain-containing protein [Vicinamibacterales bacterium]
MTGPPDRPADELTRLRACLNDLVSVMGLPAVWGGAKPSQILATLLDALLGMLRLTFVLVVVTDPDGGPPLELMRVAPPLEGLTRAEELTDALGIPRSVPTPRWLPNADVRVGDAELRVAAVPLGIIGERGVVVAGAQRKDFPVDTEALVIQVAVNEASMALQQAGVLAMQRRTAAELDERVRQRTSELAAANAALQNEVAERRRAESALRDRDRESGLIIETIPALAWTARPDGTAEFFNQRYLDFIGFRAEQATGWGWTAAVHPEDLDHVADAWRRIMASGRAGAAEARLRSRDGEYRWFLLRANPLRDDAGTIVKWYGINIDIEERRRAADAVAARERELRRLTETIPEMLWSATADGVVDYCNARFLEYTGLQPDDVTGDGWQKVVHADDAAQMAQAWRACVAGGAEYRVEARTLRVSDHAYRWCAVTALPLRDERGRILKWHGSVIDIHDWKQAQEELRRSEQEARLIVDCIPAQVAVLGPTGDVRQINRRMAEFFGDSAGALNDWKTGDIVPPDELPAVVAAMTRAFEDGTPFEMENHLRRFDGVYRWFQIRGTPLMDPEGRVVRWYFLITDIEERKRAEDRLRRSEALLADAQRISSTGSFSWRLDTDEIACSEELRRILELGADRPVTLERIGALVHPDDGHLLADLIARARESAGTLEHEFRLLMPDGRVKYTRTHGNAVHHPDGIREYVGAMQDVTQRHLSEEALDEARAELARVSQSISVGALTASIAHEVNQPLSGIITNASTCVRLLTGQPPNVAGALETARRTIRDGNRAADVIARLRALFSNRAVTAEVQDLNDVVKEVIALVSNDVQRSRVVLRTELAGGELLVTGDRVQLQQVILNLIRNASDAMRDVEGRPRHLVIRTERDGHDRARLAVRDTGIGLDPRATSRLFDAFYTTKSDGMGIGLSISRSIIERHGGQLWAASNEGPGATFSFSVPCAPAARHDAPAPRRDAT